MKKGFVVLSHQGLTMVGVIADQLAQRGMAACVLASRSARAIAPDWLERVACSHVTDALSLTQQDVDRFIDVASRDIEIVGCISVWDAYRGLMAHANRRIGARDAAPEAIARLRDKYAFRSTLNEHGLSRKQARLLDAATFASLNERSRYFVKPRTGLASFGAFRADKLRDFAELAELWQWAAADRAYDGVFASQPEFIVEDFIRGDEFSFEVSVYRNSAIVHAIHEKVDLTAAARTVLENACVCPPVGLSGQAIDTGANFVTRCLSALSVDEGVYHVEARYHEQDGWELIEANPRIGGAYIVDSTRLHCGVDLIGRWIELIGDTCEAQAAEARRKTFFRVFFGEPGRIVARLDRRDTGHPSVIDKLFVKEGERLPQADREIFIGQALWDVTSIPSSEFDAFVDTSKAHFAVEYQA
ncbi:ATP-grasp domain-containing protein [Trinickia acidisoli]|uniref:ATP-grasp domain-containing protein n=1 Tax=Trinickia acidisoli TaxID=2767482 RepID=UPI001A8D1499|nr:ATP-grasp domain-containing protein [Trinickia acidisoli]